MQLKKPVKGIFFDLGWTLLQPPSGSWLYSKLFASYFTPEKLSALPQERVKAVFSQASDFFSAHVSVADIREEEAITRRFFQILTQGLPEIKLSPEELELLIQDKVYNVDNFALFEGIPELLQRLSKSYRLGIISDTWPTIEPVLRHFELLPYFDAITYSFAVGANKPDSRMFEDALGKMGLPPEETVFVDDLEQNPEAAAAFGIQPVLICAKEGTKPSLRYPSISHTPDLEKLL